MKLESKIRNLAKHQRNGAMKRGSHLVASILVLALVSGFAIRSVSDLGVASPRNMLRIHITDYGSSVAAASETGPVDSVTPVVTNLPDGGLQTSYHLPDGQSIIVNTPPRGFDPLTASNSRLQEFNFPVRPSDSLALQDWIRVMSAFGSDDAPSGSLPVATNSTATKYSVIYGPWAGYSSGSNNTQSNTFVAVKGDVTVPSASTCGSTNNIAAWVGLGGTTSATNNLVQQGIECGNSNLGSGSAWRPWTEFADTANPVNFCGYTSWTFAAGDVIYQNMGYEASSNLANFFLEDITTGVAHSCSASPPSGWSYDDNTADWIMEAPTGSAVNFGTVPFSDANTELDSTGTWVTMGSQATTKWIDGSSSAVNCIAPQGIGSDSQSFSDKWIQSSCS